MSDVIPNRFLERVLALDPKYGEQGHQCRFLVRYADRQSKCPCSKDHEHDNTCYTKDGRDGSFNSWGV